MVGAHTRDSRFKKEVKNNFLPTQDKNKGKKHS